MAKVEEKKPESKKYFILKEKWQTQNDAFGRPGIVVKAEDLQEIK